MIFEELANNIFPVQQPVVGYLQNFVTVQKYIFLMGHFSLHTNRLCGE